jgi:hypothetical protein
MPANDKTTHKENHMKKRTMMTIAMLATVLMATTGANFAYARGGGGGGGGGGAGGAGMGSGMVSGSGFGRMHQNQMGYQNQYQNKYQHRYRVNQEGTAQYSGTSAQRDQTRAGLRTQLRDPAAHDGATAE